MTPHHLSRFASSTFTESRLRIMLIRIARPTATSTAATTITKNTNSWPSTPAHCRLKAISDRLAALSISSMHMKMTMMLRRISTPAAPIRNRSAATTWYAKTSMLLVELPLGQDHGRHDARQEQHARDLDRQHVVGEEHLAHLRDGAELALDLRQGLARRGQHGAELDRDHDQEHGPEQLGREVGLRTLDASAQVEQHDHEHEQ